MVGLDWEPTSTRTDEREEICRAISEFSPRVVSHVKEAKGGD